MFEKQFAWCGILSPILFILALLTFSFLHPNYSNLTSAISELGVANTPGGLAWNLIGFILVGVLSSVFAWGLHLGLRPHNGAIVLPALVGVSGLGWLGLGIFPAAANFHPSPATTLHFGMVALNYLPFIALSFLYAYYLRHHPYWQHWIAVSLALGSLAICSFFLPAAIPAGISQRVGVIAYHLWIWIMAVALLRRPVLPAYKTRNVLLTLLVGIFALMVTLLLAGPVGYLIRGGARLPEPTGLHQIGRTRLAMVDAQRDELFTESVGDQRVIEQGINTPYLHIFDAFSPPSPAQLAEQGTTITDWWANFSARNYPPSLRQGEMPFHVVQVTGAAHYSFATDLPLLRPLFPFLITDDLIGKFHDDAPLRAVSAVTLAFFAAYLNRDQTTNEALAAHHPLLYPGFDTSGWGISIAQ